MSMKLKRITVLFSLFLFCFAAFAEFSIVNPVPGTWANKQTLLLVLPEGEIAYYSVNGSDPLVSGFAYDDPVVIDVAGDVEIRIVSIDENGRRTQKSVSYTVTEHSREEEDAKSFFYTFLNSPVYEYVPGSKIAIPSSFNYAIGEEDGEGAVIYLPAKTLSLSSDCSVSRYVPLTLTDGNSFWRGIIHVSSAYGIINERSVPFSVENWTTISFNDKTLIYSIDDGWWRPAGDPVEIDRYESHTIRWQSAAFESGNPIYSFELPPRAVLVEDRRADGSVVYSATQSGIYKISVSSRNKDNLGVKNTLSPGLFSEMCIDVFEGDSVSEKLTFSLYADNVYQGDLSVRYRIDRRPPAPPVLIPSVSGFWIRAPLDINIVSEKKSRIYCAVSSPLELESDFSAPVPSKDFFDSVALEKYTEFKGNILRIAANPERPVYNKISVYAQDAAGNKSIPSEYSAVIDVCNYYFDSGSNPTLADGTKERPFTSFEQFEFTRFLPRFINLHVRGKLVMPPKRIVLPANCKISGSDGACLVFAPETSFDLRVSSLEIENCAITKTSTDRKEAKSLFSLENAILSLDNCEIVALFEDSGSVIQSASSIVLFKNTDLVSQARSYSSLISASDTRISVFNCRVSAVAKTAVAFSLHGGHFELRSSSCKTVGSMGRIAELFGCGCRMTDNSFVGEISLSRASQAVWTDPSVKIFENSNNKTQGF